MKKLPLIRERLRLVSVDLAEMLGDTALPCSMLNWLGIQQVAMSKRMVDSGWKALENLEVLGVGPPFSGE